MRQSRKVIARERYTKRFSITPPVNRRRTAGRKGTDKKWGKKKEESNLTVHKKGEAPGKERQSTDSVKRGVGETNKERMQASRPFNGDVCGREKESKKHSYPSLFALPRC